MDIFKKVQQSLASVEIEKAAKTKKSPTPRFQKNPSGKVLYIVVRDPELLNENGNAKHITLIKLPIDAAIAPRNIKDLINRFGTEEAKSGKYTITDNNYAEIISHFTPANRLYKQFMKEDIHTKQTVVINNQEHELCKVAALIHQASDALDHLESIDELDVIEGQEIHQALYRVKNRLLNGAKMSDSFYNEFLFKEVDKEAVEHMRRKRKFTLEEKASLTRFAKVFDQLTPLKIGDIVKDSKVAVNIREKIKALH